MMRCSEFDDTMKILGLRSIRHYNEVIVECVTSTLLAYKWYSTQYPFKSGSKSKDNSNTYIVKWADHLHHYEWGNSPGSVAIVS